MADDFALKPHPSFEPRKGPLVLVVLDGMGLGPEDEGNAVYCARTPNLDAIHERFPQARLKAHGTAVGLPSDEDMGNSEVGHNAFGAGRVIAQGAKRVNEAIASGAMFEGEVWRELVARVKERGSALHFIGLLSDGNVHSHIEHLFAMVRKADEEGVERVFVHALLDGRDVPETSALTYIDALERVLAPISAKEDRTYRIASGGGRMYVTMDRYEADWSIVERGWKTHVLGEGRRFCGARAAVETYRAEKPGVIDQDLPPFVIGDEEGPVGPIGDGHGVVFFNFRGDRAIEISRAFEEEDFDAFPRGPRPDVYFAGMMQYDGDMLVPKRYLVTPPRISRTVGEYLARNAVRQLAISETQKFGHVTYFWNGNRTGKFSKEHETYIEVPSDRVPFETAPRMKAKEVTDRLLEALEAGEHRFYRVNYANGDMVGHTGVRQATIEAVEAVDEAVGRIVGAIERLGGIALVTADHGNADEMYERDKTTGGFKLREDGRPAAKTAHTLNPVPFCVVDPGFKGEYRLRELAEPGLANVASTVLNLLGYEAPRDYEPGLLAFEGERGHE